jgi:hypothetical protein
LSNRFRAQNEILNVQSIQNSKELTSHLAKKEKKSAAAASMDVDAAAAPADDCVEMSADKEHSSPSVSYDGVSVSVDENTFICSG